MARFRAEILYSLPDWYVWYETYSRGSVLDGPNAPCDISAYHVERLCVRVNGFNPNVPEYTFGQRIGVLGTYLTSGCSLAQVFSDIVALGHFRRFVRSPCRLSHSVCTPFARVKIFR